MPDHNPIQFEYSKITFLQQYVQSKLLNSRHHFVINNILSRKTCVFLTIKQKKTDAFEHLITVDSSVDTENIKFSLQENFMLADCITCICNLLLKNLYSFSFAFSKKEVKVFWRRIF